MTTYLQQHLPFSPQAFGDLGIVNVRTLLANFTSHLCKMSKMAVIKNLQVIDISNIAFYKLN